MHSLSVIDPRASSPAATLLQCCNHVSIASLMLACIDSIFAGVCYVQCPPHGVALRFEVVMESLVLCLRCASMFPTLFNAHSGVSWRASAPTCSISTILSNWLVLSVPTKLLLVILCCFKTASGTVILVFANAPPREPVATLQKIEISSG